MVYKRSNEEEGMNNDGKLLYFLYSIFILFIFLVIFWWSLLVTTNIFFGIAILAAIDIFFVFFSFYLSSKKNVYNVYKEKLIECEGRRQEELSAEKSSELSNLLEKIKKIDIVLTELCTLFCLDIVFIVILLLIKLKSSVFGPS